jgi:hypothetical protein
MTRNTRSATLAVIAVVVIISGVLAVERGEQLGFVAVGLGIVMLAMAVLDDMRDLRSR